MRAELARSIEARVDAKVTGCREVGGGDINDAFAIALGDGRRLFVKAHADAPAGMFAAEAHGLGWLGDADAIRVPAVIAVDESFLVLEWLDDRRDGDFEVELGRQLALLHRSDPGGFGLARPNFLATLAQANHRSSSWSDFWMNRRLRPFTQRAIAERGAPRSWLDHLDRLDARFDELAGPTEPPSRLHGDLWRGNVHADGRRPALIDPAVYGGHREVDLAMLALFGGLSERLVAAYHEVYPLEAGWRSRQPLWQLYPLLAHLLLFGGRYLDSVDGVLRRFAEA